MTPRSFFSIVLKIAGIFFIKGIVTEVPGLLVSLFSLVQIRSTAEVIWTLVFTLFSFGVYTLLAYQCLFRTDFIIDTLKLDKGFTEEKFTLDISTRTTLLVAVITTAAIILILAIPDFCRSLVYYFQVSGVQYDMVRPELANTIAEGVKVAIGFLLIGERKWIVSFIEQKQGNANTAADQDEIYNAPPDQVIVSERVFHEPVSKVYKAWTNPLHLAKWWGPKGFTNTFHEYDLQPGGRWKFTMHGPENGHYQNECVFLEIVPNQKLLWDRISKPHFKVLVIFSEEPNGTKVVFKMIFNSAEESNKLRNFVPEKNEENFDRLEEELSKM